MSDDGVAEVVLGAVLTLGGLATLIIPSVPVICVGAIIFGPIMLASGFIKMSRAPRANPPIVLRAYQPAPRVPIRAASPPLTPVPPVSTPVSPPAPPTPVACPKCGNQPPTGARFCNRCGAPMTRS